MGNQAGALDAVLAAMLPSAAETSLLRASLSMGNTAQLAWTACQERFGNLLHVFRQDTRGLKRWMPLLHDALLRNGLTAAPELATVLRTAAFQEELRSERYQGIVGETLARLQAAGVPFLTLKGPALERLYPHPALRHNHDLELLLREPTDLGRVITLLERVGARPASAPEAAPSGSRVLEHAAGLPIRLSTRLFRTPHYQIATESLWTRRSTVALAGAPAQVLAPDDTLLHVLGHAASSASRTSLQWVADAWFLLQRHPELEWSRLESTACEGQLRLVLTATLPYLARELGAAIPESVLTRVTRGAEAIPRVERDALLSSLRSSGDGEVRRMLVGLSSPRERLRLLLWLLGPSPAYLRQVYGPRPGVLPFLYVYRSMAYAVRLLPRQLRWLGAPSR